MKIAKIIANILLAGVVILVGLVMATTFMGNKFGKLLIVTSGSMEPKITTGSLIWVMPQKEYKFGEIIAFHPDGNKKEVVTHRIVGTNAGTIRTAGDANNQPDFKPTLLENVVGKVRIQIPMVGYIAGWVKTPPGFILTVIVPATIIIYEELKAMKEELKKWLARLRTVSIYYPHKYGGKWFGNRGSAKSKNAFAWVPIMAAIFVTMAVTRAYFFDKISTKAVLGLAAPTPTLKPAGPQPGDVVINEISSKGTSDKEWVELFNRTGAEINLSNWTITDNTSTDTFPATSSALPIGGYAIIITDDSKVTGIPATAQIIKITGNIGNGLSDSSDHLILKSPASVVIDQVSYGSDNSVSPHVDGSPGENHSITRKPNGVYPAVTENWFSNYLSVSLGGENP